MTEIKNKSGEVIFTSASSNDTVKQAVEQAVEANVSLMDAALQGAALQGADLQGADLRAAHLGKANLSRAKLDGASMSYAELRFANLEYASLWRADLQGADISWAGIHGAKIILGNRNVLLWGKGHWEFHSATDKLKSQRNGDDKPKDWSIIEFPRKEDLSIGHVIFVGVPLVLLFFYSIVWSMLEFYSFLEGWIKNG
jgi:hypothetical protein